ncbi:MAG: FHA domain-containing protein [Thermoguttaceae bacterium]|jgi:hypothetical protein
MGFILQLPSGKRMALPADAATIGQDPACDVALPRQSQVQPRHARIRKVANKWMIESAGDWLLQVGAGVPGRKLWLNPGEVIRLSETGPELVFYTDPGLSVADSGPSVRPEPLADTAEAQPPPETLEEAPPAIPELAVEEPESPGGELAGLFQELSGPSPSREEEQTTQNETAPWMPGAGDNDDASTKSAAAFPQFENLDELWAPLYRELPPLIVPELAEEDAAAGDADESRDENDRSSPA